MKADLNTEVSKVVTVGGSYPGNLAAWFRLKYPAVTAGSIASSAPVTAQTNFKEYMDVVGQSLIHFSGQQCFNAFQLAAEIIANLALQGVGSGGMLLLQNDFKTCNPISSELDLAGMILHRFQLNNRTLEIQSFCSIAERSDGQCARHCAVQ